MGYWKRHPKKELEAVLRQLHEWGWRIENPPTYYGVKCPCGKHKRWVHLTPSGANYATDVLKWAARQCKNEQGDQR